MSHKLTNKICSTTVILLLILNLLPHHQPVLAQSAGLNSVKDVIDNYSLATTSYHSLSFTLPDAASQTNITDYIIISLPYFFDTTPPTLMAGTYGGTPSYSADGNQTVRVTGITILPGNTVTIEGFTATNPYLESQFTVNVTIAEDYDGEIIKNFGTTQATVWEGGVVVSATVDNQTARLLINGYSAPDTYIMFTEGESIIGTDVAGPTGYFAKLFPAAPIVTHNISIYGIDPEDRTTSVFPITVYTPVYQQTTVSNVLLSPTLEIDDTSILQGDQIVAAGTAVPGASVTLFTDTPLRSYTASASATGDWTKTITDTDSYTVGDYRIYAIAQYNSIQSLISPTILFSVASTTGAGSTGSSCGDITEGDLNCDGTINLVDFSILMYYWGTTNAAADINNDYLVDLTDFSIMMYWWGT